MSHRNGGRVALPRTYVPYKSGISGWYWNTSKFCFLSVLIWIFPTWGGENRNKSSNNKSSRGTVWAQGPRNLKLTLVLESLVLLTVEMKWTSCFFLIFFIEDNTNYLMGGLVNLANISLCVSGSASHVCFLLPGTSASPQWDVLAYWTPLYDRLLLLVYSLLLSPCCITPLLLSGINMGVHTGIRSFTGENWA